MSTTTFIVDNRLDIPITFWSDMLACKEAMDMDPFYDCRKNVKAIADEAFNTDHGEHMVAWMTTTWAQTLFIKHNVSGYIVLDGEGELYAYRVLNGQVSPVDVELKVGY